VTSFVLLDHAPNQPNDDSLAPITTARPLAEVRAGARLIRERWESAFGIAVRGVVGATRLQGFEEPSSAPLLHDDDVLDAGTMVGMSHFAPALPRVLIGHNNTWTHNGAVIAATLTRATRVAELRESGVPAGTESAPLPGWMLLAPWDLIGNLPAMLAADAQHIASSDLPVRAMPADVRVLGDHPVRIDETAVVEPFVVLDASQGAIVVEAHAVVRSFSRLTGPFVLGQHSQWMAGAGHTVSIGDHCKVSGEVSTTIVCGHANKGHDGFVGHSYLGRWSNLGAGTVTSNLKNTYGSVSFAGQNTGLQFLGSLIGDHAKTGILTRLTTGSSIGAGSNVISDDVVPRVVPAFSFSNRGELYDCEKFLDTATRVMARRKVAMSGAMRACLRAVYSAATTPVAP
jgi:UDP-N-acetylglucosamine diphosphorylase / glucose-1-phosphate thymidylyltransferase / UDP-N-acetylgalactosamine diphosphorylase / glucosamine-1-phosphate N-acetyltransferase / galactosamine-1-phosphate N-acetyltransferase